MGTAGQPGPGGHRHRHDRTEELLPDQARPGWWQLDTDLVPGTRYGYLLDDDDTPLPDPRSQRLPDGVHGLTEVYDETPTTGRTPAGPAGSWPAR